MTRLVIALPCAARELEDALHRVCDHDGLWDGEVRMLPPRCGRDPYNYSLEIETEVPRGGILP